MWDILVEKFCGKDYVAIGDVCLSIEREREREGGRDDLLSGFLEQYFGRVVLVLKRCGVGDING